MSKLLKNVNLLPYNTFKVNAVAKYFAKVHSPDDLVSALTSLNPDTSPIFILGQGANTLFVKNYDGLVLLNEIKGKKVLCEDRKSVTIEISSGEDWHNFVMWSVDNGWSGIENLAYIPGTVGAAPIQNLAAYGQNFGECVVSVTGFYLDDLKIQTLSYKECEFYYRESIFKHKLKNKFIITSVTVRLSKIPIYDTGYHSRFAYESLESILKKISPPPYTPKQIAQAIISLRQIKLPDWTKLGTAGSVFKNPFVSKEKYEDLKNKITDLQIYPVNKMLYPNPDDPVFKMADMVKIPVARLLDELGWRAVRIGNVGTFDKHALVVVNFGNATGKEIYDFISRMKDDVEKTYDIRLETEVNIIS